MTLAAALALLGLERDELTHDRVRRTYLRRLRDFPPERDPDGFRALRDAYEVVKVHAREDEAVAPARATAPVVIFESVAAPVGEPPPPAPPVVEAAPPPVLEAAPPAASAVASTEPPPLVPEGAPAADPAEVLRAVMARMKQRATEPPPKPLAAAPKPPADPPKPLADPPKPLAAPPRPLAVASTDLPPLASPPAPPPVLPPLGTLVRDVLALLTRYEITRAKQREAAWLAHPDATDFRSAPSPLDVARWHVVRELLAVAGNLPPRVVEHLANGIQTDDLAGTKPALVAFRDAYPEQAKAAHDLLAARARGIFAQVDGSLWSPPVAPRPPLAQARAMFDRTVAPVVPSYAPPPRTSSGGAGKALGVLGVVVMAVVRLAMTSSSSSSSFDYNHYNIDLPKLGLDTQNSQRTLELLKQMETDPYLRGSSSYDPPPAITLTRDDQLANLKLVLAALGPPSQLPRAQAARVASLVTALDTGECRKIAPAWRALKPKPGAHLAAKVAESFDVIALGIADVCPDGPATPTAPGKPGKPGKPAAP